MELIMYHIAEVDTRKREEEFLKVPALLYEIEQDDRWVSPLYSDTRRFFDKRKNPLLKDGEVRRWILYDVNKNLMGRIAAFYWKNDSKNTSLGYFGFFECADDKEGARLLFEAASKWLSRQGMKGMTGPFHLGGPGFFTGSLIRGFFEPVYGVPYNAAFYNDLFLENGFKIISKYCTHSIPLTDTTQWKFVIHQTDNFYHDVRYTIKTFDPRNGKKFAADFTLLFNKTWAKQPGMAPMSLQRAVNRCKTLRSFLIKKTILFLYFDEQPAGFLITVPDIHQIIKKFKGKYNIFDRIYLWIMVHIFKKIKVLSGLIYSIAPEFQGRHLEAVLLYSLQKNARQGKLKFNELRINRIGDENPEMKKVVQQLNSKPYHQYVTYRLMFDTLEK